MIKINIICVGTTNEKFVQMAIEKYKLLLSKYSDINFIELPDVKNSSKLEIPILKKNEAELISKHIPQKSSIFYLDEYGKENSSTEWAKNFEKMSIQQSQFTYIIGGAFGLDYNHLPKGEKLSLSKLTFTHQMARIVVLEQLYRITTIIKGTSYHHS